MSDIKRVILKPFDKDRFELTEPYEYRGIQIPAGYKTNGANIPRIFWSIFPPNSPEYLSAIVVHDFLCDEAERHYKSPLAPPQQQPSRATTQVSFKFYKQADETLKEMLLALGVAKFKANLFYICCRCYHILRYGADR